MLELKKIPHSKFKSYTSMYAVGNIEILDSKVLTIVGSRKISPYGVKHTKNICKCCIVNNIVTCSGFVEGVDKQVFLQTLNNNGTTICCLGYGFLDLQKILNINFIEEGKKTYIDFKNKGDKVLKYLNENRLLFLSQFKIDQSASKWTFPVRDKLLADVGDATLVIEATEKSGTSYTVNHCVKKQKPVFALPGNIDSQNSVGTNNYIKKDQAQLYNNFDQVLQSLQLKKVSINSNSSSVQNNNFSKDELLIINALKSGFYHFDDICKKTNICSDLLNSLLTNLEVMGYLSKEGSKYSLA